MSSRVLVIGGRGFYGQRVVTALRALAVPGAPITVHVAGRRGAEVTVDLQRPETFTALDGFDLVVNCSDTVGAPPDAAARHCLERGLTFMDMGADAPTVARLLALGDSRAGEGVVIVGVGIFPGLSTALAHHVYKDAGRPERVELGVRLSPLSGAGRANCDLMTRMLDVPAVHFEGGRAIEGPPVGPAVPLPYAGVGLSKSSRVGLPDAALIQRATGAASVATYLATTPGFLRLNFRLLAGLISLCAAVPPLRRLMLWFTRWSLIATRAALLRGVKTAVQLTAIAGRGTPDERGAMLEFEDGHSGTALGVAATVACWLEHGRGRAPAGVHTVADLYEIDALLAGVARVAGAPTPTLLATGTTPGP